MTRSEDGWRPKAPPGNGPHRARLRGGNEVEVVYRNVNKRRGPWTGYCLRWVYTRTRRPVQPLEFFYGYDSDSGLDADFEETGAPF